MSRNLLRIARMRHHGAAHRECQFWIMALAGGLLLGDVGILRAEQAQEQVFGFSGPLVARRLRGISWPSPWSCWAGLTGEADIQVQKDPSDSSVSVLRLRAVRASFVLYRDLRSRPFAVEKYPNLSWKWKAIRLPTGGNANDEARNDQVLQVYLAFPRRDGYDILGYVWDNPARPGDKDVLHPVYRTIVFGRVEGYIHIVRRGLTDDWVTEKRNVIEDYRKYFKSAHPQIVAVGIWCDSNDTGSVSEGLIGPLVFSP